MPIFILMNFFLSRCANPFKNLIPHGRITQRTNSKSKKTEILIRMYPVRYNVYFGINN